MYPYATQCHHGATSAATQHGAPCDDRVHDTLKYFHPAQHYHIHSELFPDETGLGGFPLIFLLHLLSTRISLQERHQNLIRLISSNAIPMCLHQMSSLSTEPFHNHPCDVRSYRCRCSPTSRHAQRRNSACQSSARYLDNSRIRQLADC